MKHTFVICAYKESKYLEKCINSLKRQTVKSDIIMTTSTPNEYIKHMAEKYSIPLFIRDGEPEISTDWNFAIKQADSPYVTIAHQDDIYLPDYTKRAVLALQRAKKPLIYFSDYAELRNKKIVKSNRLLKIKRLMLFPLRFRFLSSNRFVRRRILSFGSPICCPSVAYAKDNLPEDVFATGFRSNEDWEAWEYISKLQGEFLYDKSITMYHRIHKDSETTAIIKDNKRSDEDMKMYRKFWPWPIAKILVHFYSSGQKSNEL